MVGGERQREDPAMGMGLATMGIGLAAAGDGTVGGTAMGIDLLLGQPPSKYRRGWEIFAPRLPRYAPLTDLGVSARVSSSG